MTQTDAKSDVAVPYPPSHLTADPAAFWRAGADLATLSPPQVPPQPPALERLGPSPFPKSRFPFLGFLATVYDHVAAHVTAGPARG